MLSLCFVSLSSQIQKCLDASTNISMEGLGNKELYRRSSHGHFLIVLMLTIWLPLILYTLKRQFDNLKRRRHIANIKKLQLEVRRKLKREQLTFNVTRSILHASMTQCGASRVRKIDQLTDLQSLHHDINEQLEKLEIALNC